MISLSYKENDVFIMYFGLVLLWTLAIYSSDNCISDGDNLFRMWM